MEIKTYAPILIPTLNRFEHLKRCVESLSKCTHADKTELVIGLDYPPSEKYIEGWKQISDYVTTITGFKKVTVFRREENLGPRDNSKKLREYARANYDRYITSEDDNEFSPNFLDYMNKGLEKYKDHPKVFAICGYNYLEIDMSGYENDYYFSHEMNAWGWGSWFNEKCDNVLNMINKSGYLMELIKNVPFRVFLKDGLKRCNLLFNIGLDKRGDAYLTYYQWNYDMYCMFPRLSMSRNHGFDGSGVHCGGVGTEIDPHSVQLIDDRIIFESDFDLPVLMDEKIQKIFKSFQRGSLRVKIKKFILLILMKLFVCLRKF